MNLKQTLAIAAAFFGVASSGQVARAEVSVSNMTAQEQSISNAYTAAPTLVKNGREGGRGSGSMSRGGPGPGFRSGPQNRALSSNNSYAFKNPGASYQMSGRRHDRDGGERDHDRRHGHNRYYYGYNGFGYGGYGYDDGYDGYSYGIASYGGGSCYANCREEHGPRFCRLYASNYCD